MIIKQPRTVRGWAKFHEDGEISVWLDKATAESSYSGLTAIVIAPTATHAVVELARVKAWLDRTSKNDNSQGRRLLVELGIKLPPAPKKCPTCKGEGTLTVGGADGIKCWTCNGGKPPKKQPKCRHKWRYHPDPAGDSGGADLCVKCGVEKPKKGKR